VPQILGLPKHLALGRCTIIWPGGAAVVNGTIYVFSGDGNYFYDPATCNWSEFAPMPTPMAAFAVAACDNEIYVMGEVNPYQPPLNSAVNEVYDPYEVAYLFSSELDFSIIAELQKEVVGFCLYNNRET
jgi:hypothetical protein